MTRPTPPILFLVFNRPDTTRLVFEQVRRAMPTRLYIAADGPRADREGEQAKCDEVRRIASEVNWECEVYTMFGKENRGCGVQLTSAIGWFFEHEEEGIILEDDCLPSESFIPFCAELLERYRDDTRVMMIGSNNLEEPSDREKDYSYTFSRLTYIWGWASWRRAWKYHDFYMNKFKEIDVKKYLIPVYQSIHERNLFQYVFARMHQGDDSKPSRKDSWDYQWQFACLVNSGLTIVPTRNLVTNIGFGDSATSTSVNSPGQGLVLEDINFPLRHPQHMMIDHRREKRTFELCHTSKTSRLKNRIKSLVPAPLMGIVKNFFVNNKDGQKTTNQLPVHT